MTARRRDGGTRVLRAPIVIALLGVASCERADPDRTPAASAGPTAGSVAVPPALPGEPPLGADRERMLQLFATNISQGLYTPSNLRFLLCNTEAGLAVARQAADPMSMALMRRMVALFRSAPGMANTACPATPPRMP